MPEVEKLPPAQLLGEYLARLEQRFSVLTDPKRVLVPPSSGEEVLPRIPVTVTFGDTSDGHVDLREAELASRLHEPGLRLFVEGAPGAGKSTLCKRVAVLLAEDGRRRGGDLIPIYVHLARGVPSNAVEALSLACAEMGVRIFPNLYERSLRQANVVLILDGLDEITSPELDVPKFEALIRGEPTLSIIVTSRPLATDELYASMLANGFTSGLVRELTDEELHGVFEEHLLSPQTIETILTKTDPRLRAALHSPLFALLAIRVAQSNTDWNALSRFRLLEQYVAVLHGFFNATTVRGSDMEVPLDTVMSCLSEVALTLSPAGQPAELTLQEVANHLDERGIGREFAALLNLGIITARRGIVTFVHRIFFEFGIARSLLATIKKTDMAAFTRLSIAEDVYELIAGELNQSDEATLLEWLSSPDKHVRRRVYRVLHYQSSPKASEAVRVAVRTERSLRAWSAAIRMLVAQGEEEFIRSLIGGSRLPPRKTRILAWALRQSRKREILLPALELAQRRRQHAATAAVFELALEYDVLSIIVELRKLYFQDKPHQRRALCALINQYRSTMLSQRLSVEILQEEMCPSAIIRLLDALRDRLADLPLPIISRTSSVITMAKGLHARDRRRLRRVVDTIESASPLAHLLELREVCWKKGAYLIGEAQANGSDVVERGTNGVH